MAEKNCRYDIEAFTEELGAEVEEMATLYSNYIQEMKDEVLQIQQLVQNNDKVMLQRVIHNVKGVSANLSINDVFEEAAKLDTILKENGSKDIDIYVEKIIGLIQEAEKEIKNYFLGKGITIADY